MIDVLARNDRTAFGLTAMLDIERRPYRRVAQPAESAGRVVLLAHADGDEETVRLLERGPSLTIGDGGQVRGAIFGIEVVRRHVGAAVLSLDEPIWPAALRARAAALGITSLRIPALTAWQPEGDLPGELLAEITWTDGTKAPAIVARGRAVWSMIDFAAAFTDLLDESYREPQPTPRRAMPGRVLAAYYAMPERVRRLVQRRTYRRLVSRLADEVCPSDYPVDAAGWLLIELLGALLRRTGVPLVRLGRWPAPYRSAAALTHDLEPNRYAYTEGLRRLRARVAATGHRPTYGVVARAVHHLSAEDRTAIAAADVLCHGLEHRGETIIGTREDVAAGVVRARAELQVGLGRPVTGFRSPRLDRSGTLLWALDRAGFAFDSSYPDVDRENLLGYGTGVRLNLPFRPPIANPAEPIRASRCLELPVSAPDCIQPLFEGHTLRGLRRAVRQKIRYTCATEGLYVGIVHAGVFGARDAARRGAHLGFVHRLLRQPDVWVASLSEIAAWWRLREQVSLHWQEGRTRVTNLGDQPVLGLRCFVEHHGHETEIRVPPLHPGDSTLIPTGTA